MKIRLSGNGVYEEFVVHKEEKGILFTETVYVAYSCGFLSKDKVGEHKNIEELAQMLKSQYGAEGFQIVG